jgi:hypothetical protein
LFKNIIWLLLANKNSYTPSQADVQVFKQLKTAPAPEKYPYAWRWYNHLVTFEGEFSSLPGDPTKEYTAYGPEQSELPINPAKAPAAEEDDDEVDLFGSDDEEEDAAAAKLKEERLAEYNKKKAGKVKPAAKSIVTLDVKPWGTFLLSLTCRGELTVIQTMRPISSSSRPTLLALNKMVSFGVVQSMSPSVSVSRSCKSTWSSRTTRCLWTIYRRRSRKTKIMCNRPTLLPCRSCRAESTSPALASFMSNDGSIWHGYDDDG